MTYQEIAELIASLNIPYAYYQFPEGTEVAPPFICFYYSGENGFNADNKQYAKKAQLIIELYTNEKDFPLEAQIEALLNDNELPFIKLESYIDSEKLLMQTYESEVFING